MVRADGSTIAMLNVPEVALAAAASVTLTVKLKLPVVLGVPEMTPPAERPSPGGSAPEARDQVYGGDPPLDLGHLRTIREQAAGRTSIHCLHFGRGPLRDSYNFLARIAGENRGSYVYIDMNVR